MNDLNTFEFLKFFNPSLGEMLFGNVISTVVQFMKDDAAARYNVMIGSDSNGFDELDLVSVVAVHRLGLGGRYFWHRQTRRGIVTLRQKIYAEVEASLDLAKIFLPAFQRELLERAAADRPPFNFQIHVDVGENGETRDLIREVTGMVTGMGYDVLIKPESAAATTVADRHVR